MFIRILKLRYRIFPWYSVNFWGGLTNPSRKFMKEPEMVTDNRLSLTKRLNIIPVKPSCWLPSLGRLTGLVYLYIVLLWRQKQHCRINVKKQSLRNLRLRGFVLLAAFIPFLLVSEKPAKVSKRNTRTDCKRKIKVVTYPVLNFEKKKSGSNKSIRKPKRNRYSFPV